MKGNKCMHNEMIGNENNILSYSDAEGNPKVEVVLQDEKCLAKYECDCKFFLCSKTRNCQTYK